jgi:hypothetical protein
VEAADEDILHPFALEGMGDIARAGELVALDADQTDHHTFARQALQAREFTDGHLLDHFIIHVAADLHALPEYLCTLGCLGQPNEARQRIAWKDAAPVAHGVAIIIIARRFDQDHMHNLPGLGAHKLSPCGNGCVILDTYLSSDRQAHRERID